MTRCRRTDALLASTFAGDGLTAAQAAHAASCRTCARELSAARRFDVELDRAAESLVRAAEADVGLRRSPSDTHGGVTMRKLGAVVAIIAIAGIAIVGYGGGQWIGSLVDIGFDHDSPVIDARLADEEAERAAAEAAAVRAAAEDAARAAAEIVRGAASAVPDVEESGPPIPNAEADAVDAELARATCGAWASMTAEDQLGAVEGLVGHVIERVRVSQQLSEAAERDAILAAARASLDKGCQGSPDDREIVVIARWLYGRGH